jgi:6-phosphogluconolactonase/glucosamine-6-phosphate isomerase/deaminase
VLESFHSTLCGKTNIVLAFRLILKDRRHHVLAPVRENTQQEIGRRVVNGNVWLSKPEFEVDDSLGKLSARELQYEVLESEQAVGRAMLQEIEAAADSKQGDLVIILLGGRGGQALHRLLGKIARTSEKDKLLARLNVFTQDALAPMRMANGFSFVRDFERLLGPDFFSKVKSFTSMSTDSDDAERELARYIDNLHAAGGIDIFFLGLGPEPAGASHLAYIKPGSGARVDDVAGMIPISSSILEHHITKFKVGGSEVTETDETECRAATHILTLGPAAILGARRIIQSIVDASTAPKKRESYRTLLDTEISEDQTERAAQLDENPGLWLRLHPNVRSLILTDVLEA